MKRQSQSKEAEHFTESHLTDMNDVIDRFSHIIIVVVVVVPQTRKKGDEERKSSFWTVGVGSCQRH